MSRQRKMRYCVFPQNRSLSLGLPSEKVTQKATKNSLAQNVNTCLINIVLSPLRNEDNLQLSGLIIYLFAYFLQK